MITAVRRDREMMELAVQELEKEVEKENMAKAVEDAEDDQHLIKVEKVQSLRQSKSGTTCTTR